MDAQPPETRLKLLETRVDTAEKRIAIHGKEIDDLKEHIVRSDERGAYRDKQMASIETKLDRMDGKIDLMAAAPGEKWDKAVWVVVSVVITAVVTALVSRLII